MTSRLHAQAVDPDAGNSQTALGPVRSRLLALSVWGTAFILGGVQAFVHRFDMNADGISYLSLGELYSQGEWSSAVNGYWSPAYPLALGLVRLVVGTAERWEAPVAHGLNFVLFLASLACFRFFVNQMQRAQCRARAGLETTNFLIDFTKPAVSLVAHAMFLWSGLVLIGLWYVTPDTMVACVVFGLAGLIVRFRSTNAGSSYYAIIGATAALGYLTKTAMFPLGWLVVFSCALGLGTARSWLTRTAAAAFGFLVVASPQIIAQSRLVGRFSYGETGTVAYAQYVNGVPQWWTGAPPGSGIPVHPVRQINHEPAAYEFSTPVSEFSYPYRDQPAYWAEGIRPRFDLQQQLEVTVPILDFYLQQLTPLILVLLTLVILSRPLRISRAYLPLIIPAIGAYGLYALVYSESRYLGAWTVVLFMAAVASMRFPSTRRWAVHGLLGLVAIFSAFSITDRFWSDVKGAAAPGSSSPGQYTVAMALRSLGIGDGTRVAHVGRSYEAYWARLAKVQIAFEVPDATSYWSSSERARSALHRRFAEAGAKAIVVRIAGSERPGTGWQRLGESDYFVLLTGGL